MIQKEVVVKRLLAKMSIEENLQSALGQEICNSIELPYEGVLCSKTFRQPTLSSFQPLPCFVQQQHHLRSSVQKSMSGIWDLGSGIWDLGPKQWPL